MIAKSPRSHIPAALECDAQFGRTKITFASNLEKIPMSDTLSDYWFLQRADDLQFTKDNCRVCRGTGLVGTSVEDEQGELMTPCPHCLNLKLNLKGLS